MLDYGNVQRLYEPADGAAWTGSGAMLGRCGSIFRRRSLGVCHDELGERWRGWKDDDDLVMAG